MLKRSALAILLLSSFLGCGERIPLGPGVQDFTATLPNGYVLVRSSSHDIQVVPKDGWNSRTPIIPAKVLEIGIDGDFVVARRQGLKKRSPEDPDDFYLEPDPSVLDFWVLDTKKPAVFGPLDEGQLAEKLAALGFADGIPRKDVYEYRR